MPSKDEASQFFKKFGNTVSSSSTRRSSGEEATKNRANTGATPGKDALLTQVQQAQAQQAQKDEKSSSARRSHYTAAGVEKRLADIKLQPKNMSPVDAARHPSLLPRPVPAVVGRKCLVLDVDETLVHSSYQPVKKYDLHLPLRVNGNICNVYVAYRPKLREFLQAMAPLYEVVIFTASVSVYCDPLMNNIDPKGALGTGRLFREHCSVVNGSYVKDLSLLGRPLDQVCIIDNSPVAYLFQPRNAIPILSWFDDPADEELMKLVPILQQMATSRDVYEVLDEYNALVQEQAAAEGEGEKVRTPTQRSIRR